MTRPTALMNAARLVLLDFDGPAAHMFYGYPARALADDFRRHLGTAGVDVPDALVAPGPFEVYRSALDQRPDLADSIEAWLVAGETRAAQQAQPTPGCRDLLLAAKAAGKPLVIVSNNAEAAIRTYLEREHLAPYVAGIAGRPHAAPDRMKPSPWSILRTAQEYELPPSSCVFIGDSVFDVEAGNAAGCPTIGYANKPGKAERLARAGAAALIDDMNTLADALGSVHNLTPGG